MISIKIVKLGFQNSAWKCATKFGLLYISILFISCFTVREKTFEHAWVLKMKYESQRAYLNGPDGYGLLGLCRGDPVRLGGPSLGDI